MTSFMLSRRHAVVSGAALLLSSAAFAAAPGTDADAIAPIRALNAGLIRIMRAGRATPFVRRFDMLAPDIDRAFDLPRILAVSVGEGWAGLAPADKAALMAAFRRYTVASYVENFDSFDGQRFDLAPATRPVPGGAQVVLTTIVAASGERHQIDYVMRKTGTEWKAVDVLADGAISRVAVQRSDFRQLLDHGGAPALVASLTRKAEDLARG